MQREHVRHDFTQENILDLVKQSRRNILKYYSSIHEPNSFKYPYDNNNPGFISCFFRSNAKRIDVKVANPPEIATPDHQLKPLHLLLHID